MIERFRAAGGTVLGDVLFLRPLSGRDAASVRTLPLTALNDSLRGVMIDGATLGTVARPLAVVVAWGAVSFVVALKIFRWR